MPRVRKPDTRRGGIVAFRCTDAEAEAIRALAARRKISVSACIREAALREVEASR